MEDHEEHNSADVAIQELNNATTLNLELPNITHPSSDSASSSLINCIPAKKNKKTHRTKWENDGPDSSMSSLSVLLDWLSAEGNYIRWRGGDKSSGETKSVLATQISSLIQSCGIRTLRKPKDIISKISQLEMSFRNAVDFLNGTGAGIQNEATLNAAIKERCPYYDTLKKVMEDRPSARPLATNEDELIANEWNHHPELQAEKEPDDAETVENIRSHKRGKNSSATKKFPQSIRSRSPSVSSTLSEWSDINTTISNAKLSV